MHCTPGPGQVGSGAPVASARQSQPVQSSEKSRQSASARQVAGGGPSQICCVHAPPGGVQMAAAPSRAAM
jgi:hypothetical protein